MAEPKIDPVTFEVISHRLWQINDEMGITLKNVSGSPVCTESNDFNVGTFLPDGSLVIVGAYVTHFVSTMPFLIKSTIERCDKDPGIFEDDMFIINDPYMGAVHPSDVAVLSPIFYRDEIFAWTGTAMHVLDIGAMDLAGFAIRGTEVFHEGIRFPPTKIVERGKLKKDVLNVLLNNVREPRLVGLDIRSEIAGNNVAKRRILDLVKRYGADTVKGVMQEMLRYSEEKFRQRLRELPNGTWRHIDYVDHDGQENRIYKIVLTMKKENDILTFDFTGTDKQAPTFINCNYAATWAGLYAPICTLLCYDIMWNHGIINPIKVIAPEGTLVNCKFPAPCGMSSIGTSFNVMNAATVTISKMLGCSEKYKKEVMAVWAGSWPATHFMGLNQKGEFFVAMIMDPTSGSMGARSFKDGVDSGGLLPCPTPSIQNVETNEMMYPMLYLFRKHLMDSGGAGKFRGGVAVEAMWTVYDTDHVTATLAGMGAEMSQTAGLFGGFPGSTIRYVVLRKSNIYVKLKRSEIPQSYEEIEGEMEVIPQKFSQLTLNKRDVFYTNMEGGGGYGDPLDRDPSLVLKDVLNGLVSPKCAKDLYGVVIDLKTLEIDQKNTEVQRQKLRGERIKP